MSASMERACQQRMARDVRAMWKEKLDRVPIRPFVQKDGFPRNVLEPDE
ncbi:MAG: hypothetical protein ABFC96_11820 [Thermoguttaceae bacterium]